RHVARTLNAGERNVTLAEAVNNLAAAINNHAESLREYNRGVEERANSRQKKAYSAGFSDGSQIRLETVAGLYKQGLSFIEMSHRLKVSKSTVHRLFDRATKAGLLAAIGGAQ